MNTPDKGYLSRLDATDEHYVESILLTSELDNAVNESEVNEVPSGALVFKATRTEPVLLQPTQTKYYVATIERERMIPLLHNSCLDQHFIAKRKMQDS